LGTAFIAMLQQTFFQKFFLMIFAGFVAAGMFWVFRHVVQRAVFETGEGWREMYVTPTPQRTR
jgi:hypothetical protein